MLLLFVLSSRAKRGILSNLPSPPSLRKRVETCDAFCDVFCDNLELGG